VEWKSTEGATGRSQLAAAIDSVLEGVSEGTRLRGGAVPSLTQQELQDLVTDTFRATDDVDCQYPVNGLLRKYATLLARGSVDPRHPFCLAHLHCAPLAVAVAADLATSILNPSQDSWDQAPITTALETFFVKEMAALVGLDPQLARGTVTTGGSESNLMGIMLARDHVLRGCRDEFRAAIGGLRIFASQSAHFSVRRAASFLGLGHECVKSIPLDGHDRMDLVQLARAIKASKGAGERLLAVVATAGTTDHGAIDPLADIASLAREQEVWLHVDAAYGGGALFSPRLAPLLRGIDSANSIAMDWHKFGWQPIPAGVFLVKDAATMDTLDCRVPYLNASDDEDAGYPSLLGFSLKTTRRADVFKMAVTLACLGKRELGRLVECCCERARLASEIIGSRTGLELHSYPVLSTVLFRYIPRRNPEDGSYVDSINAGIRRRLLREGAAVIGRTNVVPVPGREGPINSSIPGTLRLKLTILNPDVERTHLEDLLEAVLDAGYREENHLGWVRAPIKFA
jgi:L-2,4-diaminobutyrate decarboxylase